VIHTLQMEAVDESRLFWLTDAQFAKLEPYLPTDTRGKPRVDVRRVISGIVQVIRSGRTLVQCAYGLRPEEDALQPLPALGRQGCASSRKARRAVVGKLSRFRIIYEGRSQRDDVAQISAMSQQQAAQMLSCQE
jgi:hypothetical protein